MLLLALDPGIVHPACALFQEGVLVRASRVKLPGALAKLDPLARELGVAQCILAWLGGVRPDVLVVERPQIYRASKSPGDPNDLLSLAALNAAVGALVQAPTCKSYLPREWAGTTQKTKTGDPWLSMRGQRVHKRLSEVELATVVPSHDAVDAIGIGLHHLGRFDRIRNFSRGLAADALLRGDG